MINSSSKSPLYFQLAEIILKDIESKGLKENMRIPAERTYCEKYNLSRSTVRQAINYLEQKGYLYKIQGSGTFVSSTIYKQKLLKFYSFTEEMKKQGKVPSSEIISFKKIKSPKNVILELNLAPNDEVFELVRIRSANDEKIMYEITYLPALRFSELSEEKLKTTPLYKILNLEYGIKFDKAIERFSVDIPNKKIEKILGIKEIPIIKLQRWTYTRLEIVEYTISYVRGDKFEFEVELKEN